MTLDQLRIFIAVAELEHVTNASQQLNLTQSSVSAAIAALEARHGVSLFDRIGRGIKLNGNGEALLAKARIILAAVRDAENLLDDLANLRQGRLTIFASQTITSHWLPSRLVRFRATYPQIEIEARVGNTDQCVAAIQDGRCDLAFVEGDVDADFVEEQLVAVDYLAVIAAAGHPLSRTKWQGLTGLAGHSLILREQGSGTRSTFYAAMSAAGLPQDHFPIALELWSNEAICSAVEHSNHLGIVPWAVCEPLVHDGRLVALNSRLIERPFRMLRHKARHLPATAIRFAARLTDQR